jgi:hypothetical protein
MTEYQASNIAVEDTENSTLICDVDPTLLLLLNAMCVVGKQETSNNNILD